MAGMLPSVVTAPVLIARGGSVFDQKCNRQAAPFGLGSLRDAHHALVNGRRGVLLSVASRIRTSEEFSMSDIVPASASTARA